MKTFKTDKDSFKNIFIVVTNDDGTKYFISKLDISNHYPILLTDLDKLIKKYKGIVKSFSVGFKKEENAQKFIDEILIPYEIISKLTKGCKKC